jgi:CBS domain-containing protein
MDFFERLNGADEIFLYHIRYVYDILSPADISINLDNTVREIWSKMGEVGVDELPVIDFSGDPRKGTEKRTYVGIVRKKDLAAMGSRFVGALSQYDSDDAMMQVRLSNCDAVDRSVETVALDTPLFEAIEKLVESHSSAVAVVGDDKEHQGCLTSLDVLRCFHYLDTLSSIRVQDSNQEVRLVDLFGNSGGAMPSDRMVEKFMATAKDIMNENFHSIVGSASVGDAMSLMEKERCHSLVVVDDDGNLRGVTTSTEIQAALPPVDNRRHRVDRGAGIFIVPHDDSAEFRQARAERVISITNTTVGSVDISKPVPELARRLIRPNAQDIPVTASGNLVKGLLGRWELVKAFLALGGVLKKRGMLDE